MAASATHKTTVYLQVYDLLEGTLQATNKITSKLLGMGAFHAGVDVHGEEWYFACDAGIVACEPKSNTCHAFRETLELGTTGMSKREVVRLVERWREVWTADSYDLLSRNCCHFAHAFSLALGTGPVPAWLNRAAHTGDLARRIAGTSWGLGSRFAGLLVRSGASLSAGSARASADASHDHASEEDDFLAKGGAGGEAASASASGPQ